MKNFHRVDHKSQVRLSYHNFVQINPNQMSYIMDHDQWQCRTCDQVFQRRGQRDYHQRKEHQKFVTTIDQTQHTNTIARSTSNAFDCSCGKKFKYVQGLQRHTKSCNGIPRGAQHDGGVDSTDEDEGTTT